MRSAHEARARGPTSGAVLAACSALVLVGLGRTAYVHSRAAHARELWVPVDEARYAPLAPALAGVRTLGFVTDEGDPNPLRPGPPAHRRNPARLYIDAAYALAPRVVVPGADGAEYVLADFTRAEALAAALERHRLEPVVVVGDGLALLRRRR